jgi:hypothetical protein
VGIEHVHVVAIGHEHDRRVAAEREKLVGEQAYGAIEVVRVS